MARQVRLANGQLRSVPARVSVRDLDVYKYVAYSCHGKLKGVLWWGYANDISTEAKAVWKAVQHDKLPREGLFAPLPPGTPACRAGAPTAKHRRRALDSAGR